MLVRGQTQIHGQRQSPVEDGSVLRKLHRGSRPAVHRAILSGRLGMEHLVGNSDAQNGQ